MGYKEEIERLLALRRNKEKEDGRKSEDLARQAAIEKIEAERLATEQRQLEQQREAADLVRFSQIREELEDLGEILNSNKITGERPWTLVWVEGDAGKYVGMKSGYDGDGSEDGVWQPLPYKGWALARQVDVAGQELRYNPVHFPTEGWRKLFRRTPEYIVSMAEAEEERRDSIDYTLIFAGLIDRSWNVTLMDGMNDEKGRITAGHHFGYSSHIYDEYVSWGSETLNLAWRHSLLADPLKENLELLVGRLPEFKNLETS